jgi:hypothetical protein
MQMRQVESGKLFFSEAQLLELKETKTLLLMLNRAAGEWLRGIELSCSSYGSGAGPRGSLRTIATAINSHLQRREQILVEAREQPAELIEVVWGTYCPNCDNKTRPLGEADQEIDLPEPLKHDRAWQAEIDDLLTRVLRIEKRILLCRTSRRTLAGTPLDELNRLRKVLLRQRDHLQKTVPKKDVPQIEVLHEPEYCLGCGERRDPFEYR